MSAHSAVLVFAKIPEPGRVKTRLLSMLSPQRAADLHRACLQDTIATVSRVPGCRKSLRVAARFDRALELATALELNSRWRVGVQRGRDLGSRMRDGFECFFRSGFRKVLIVGTDTPWMGSERILRAIWMLNTSEVVLGPCTDGGYYLLGSRRLIPQLFQGIPWGTSQVLARTIRALERAGAGYRLLPRDFDLDRPGDYQRAAQMLHRDARRAPALARWIKDWELDRSLGPAFL